MNYEESLTSMITEKIKTRYMDIEYPFSEHSISFEDIDQVDRSKKDYFQL